MDHAYVADAYDGDELIGFMPDPEVPITPFANGDRVIVRLPNGSGYVMKNVRVVHVDGRTGAQTVETDECEPFDIEASASSDLVELNA